MSTTTQILESLVAFPTVSRDSNLDMIEFIEKFLSRLGIHSTLTHNDEWTKANLYAVFGPGDTGGVMLSGHTDVVPTESQNWTVKPFEMSADTHRLYGRGTTDMKGFIASVLSMSENAVRQNLQQPVHLAFSYDEEIGCVGVRRMIDMLESSAGRPDYCVVGEPTSLKVGIAHKGKVGATCRCHGVEAHSALADQGLNAIYLATEMITGIRDIQEQLAARDGQDSQFGVPYTTLHVGTIQGGTALNIIPNICEFKFEIRNLISDDPVQIMDQIRERARTITDRYKIEFAAANIDIEIFNQYPALETSRQEKIVDYVRSMTGGEEPVKIDFGTEGGLFKSRLDIPTVVCGPGSMAQGHKPDEFILKSELDRCDRFLDKLLGQLCD